MRLLDHFARHRGLAFSGALALLLLVGGLSIWGIELFANRSQWVGHSFEVLASIEAVQTGVRTAESSARAYRITESPAQQAEYLAAAPEALARADALVARVADNATQARQARRIRTLAHDRVADLQRLVDIQHTRGAEAARLLTGTTRGTRAMHELDAVAADMRGAEQRLLASRERATDRAATLLIVFVVGGTLLPLVLLGLLMSGLAREARRALWLEREARDALAQLAAEGARRDRLSEQRRALGAFGSLLQSCQTLEEAMSLSAGVLAELMPTAGGRCYLMRASQNLLDSAAQFGDPVSPSAVLLQPEQCWAMRRAQPHRCEPGRANPHCAHVEHASAGAVWTLCMPLIAQGTPLGLLFVSGPAASPLTEDDTGVLATVAEQLSQTLANLHLRETLRVQSLRDPLTGLYNRRYLEENLFRELQRCERRGQPLAVMMIDVDHFKRFNDTHGHGAGDALLSRVGEVLASMTRGEDMACRFGGEEFTLVLPEAPAEVARRRAEDIRATLAATTVTHLRQLIGPITASIGVAMFPEHGVTADTLLAAADSALYAAKAQGRNRVVEAG